MRPTSRKVLIAILCVLPCLLCGRARQHSAKAKPKLSKEAALIKQSREIATLLEIGNIQQEMNIQARLFLDPSSRRPIPAWRVQASRVTRSSSIEDGVKEDPAARSTVTEPVAVFWWRQDTGDLIHITVAHYRRQERPLGRQAEIECSWAALRALGILDKSTLWQIQRPIQQEKASAANGMEGPWTIHWRSENWQARCVLDPYDGSLWAYTGEPVGKTLP